MKRKKISYREAFKEVLKTGLPITASQIILVSRFSAETIMLARVNDDTLAANGLIESTQMFIIVVVNLGLVPVTMLVGQADATHRFSEVGEIVRQGWIYSGIFSALSTPLLCFSKPLLQGLGQSEIVSQITQDYLRGMAIGAWANWLLIVNRQTFNGLNKTGLTSFLSISETIVRVVLGYAFTFGVKIGPLSIPAMRAFGMGLSGSCSNILFAGGSFVYMALNKQWRDYQIFNRLPKEFKWLKRIAIDGAHIALVGITDFGNAVFSAFLVGHMNDRFLIPYGVANQLMLFGTMPIYSMFDAGSILAARTYGKKEYQNLKPLWAMSLLAGELIAFIYSGTYASIPRMIFSVVHPAAIEEELLDMFTHLVYIHCIGMPIDGLRMITDGSLFGMNDVSAVSRMNFSLIWGLGIPLALTLTLAFGFGPEAVTAARYFSILLSALAAVNRLMVQTSEINEMSEMKELSQESNETGYSYPHNKNGFFKKLSRGAAKICGKTWRDQENNLIANENEEELELVTSSFDAHSN